MHRIDKLGGRRLFSNHDCYCIAESEDPPGVLYRDFGLCSACILRLG
jgi:hypothetical protein